MPEVTPVQRNLPPENSVVLDPVPEPSVKGKDPRVAWALADAALVEANKRLVTSRTIYRGVRADYAKKR